MELQKLWVTLALNGKDFVKGLEDARRQAEGFADTVRGRVSGSFSLLGNIATGALMGVGAAAAGGFGLAIKSAIDMNASLEQSTMQFTTLMGDSDLAAQHVASLFDFAAKTPFETGPIIAASKHLQVFGGEALNTMENLTLVGDAAAAVGAPIDEVSFWVGRLYSNLQAGAPFGEAAARLQELGIMGPEVRAQLEGMQASGASATDIFAAFQGQLGEFTGAMDMQSRSWSGMMSTLTDTLTMAAANGLRPFFELAEKGLANLLAWLNSPEIQAGITALATGLTTVVEAVSEFVAGIASGEDPVGDFANLFYRLASVFGATKEQATGVFNAVRSVGDKVVEFVGPIAKAVADFVSFKDVLAALGVVILATVIPAVVSLVASFAPILLVGAALVGVVALVRNAWENDWGGIQEKVGAVVAFLREAFGQFTAVIWPRVQEFLGLLSERWNAVWPQIQSVLQTVWGVIQSVIQSAVAVIGPAVQGFVAQLEPLWEKVQGLFPSLVGLWEAAKPVLLGVLEVVGGVLATIVGLVSGIASGVMGALGPLVEGIIGAVSGIIHVFTGVFETIRGVFQMIVGLLTGNTELIKEGFGHLKDGIVNIISGLVGGVMSLFNGLVQGVVGFVRGLVDGVVGFFQNLFDRLVGHSIITDLVEQILALWKMLFQAVQTVVEAGLRLVRDVFSAFADLFAGDWDGFKDKIEEIWQAAWDAVVQILGTLWGMVQPKLAEVWESLSSWFREKTEALKQIGRDVITGIVSGLDEVGDKIRETLIRWATEAWDKVKEFFGISSPAEKGKDAGRNIGEGFIEGILDTGGEFWTRTEDVWQGYYTRLEDWYQDLPWEDQPAVTIERWGAGLGLLWDGLEPVFAAWYEATDGWYRDQEWESMPAYTTEVWADEWGRMGDRLRPVYDDYFATTVQIFRQQDWAGIGVEIVNGIIAGVNSKSGDLFETLVALAREALQRAKEELQIASPSQVFVEVGEQIVNGIIAGIQAARPELLSSLDGLVYDIDSTLSAAADVGGIGGGFARAFEDRTIKPIEERLDYLDEAIGGYSDSLGGMLESLGIEMDMNDPALQLALERFANSAFATDEQRTTARTALAALGERQRLTEEYLGLQDDLIRQQERLLELEKARADLDFLRAQLDLLKLVQENGLDASLLDGLQFGLQADAGDLMDVMVDVMQKLVGKAREELEISSPSRVFEDMGRQMMAGMAGGLVDNAAQVERALGQNLEAITAVPGGYDAGPRAVDNSRRAVVNGGMHVHVTGQVSALDELEVLMR